LGCDAGQSILTGRVANGVRTADLLDGLIVDPQPPVTNGTAYGGGRRTHQRLRVNGDRKDLLHFIDPRTAKRGVDLLVQDSTGEKRAERANAGAGVLG